MYMCSEFNCSKKIQESYKLYIFKILYALLSSLFFNGSCFFFIFLPTQRTICFIFVVFFLLVLFCFVVASLLLNTI